MSRAEVLGVGTLAGTIIGAGIFSLPYLARTVGLTTGILSLLAFTLVYIAVHLMYARVLETRNGEHQFFYVARQFLPRLVAPIASWIIFFELLFVLTVYLVLAPTFAHVAFGVSGFLPLVLFWIVSSACSFMRVSVMSIAESVGLFSIATIVMMTFFVGFGKPLTIVSAPPLSLDSILLLFGPLLFSLSGRPAIAKIVTEHRKAVAAGERFSITRVVVWGTSIAAVIYAIFVLSMLRLNPTISSTALDSLSTISPLVVTLLGFLGLVTLWTSYFMIGGNVYDMLVLDKKTPRWIAVGIVCAAPFILYSIGSKDFLSLLGFTGGVFLGLEGLFVVALWLRTKARNVWQWYASLLLGLVFVVAIVREAVVFFVK